MQSPFLRISAQVVVLLFVSCGSRSSTGPTPTRRGAMSVLWGIVAVILPYLGTLIYLVVRPPEYLEESRKHELELAVLERELRNNSLLCPNCRNLVKKDYLICPVCNWELKKPCVNCERPINMEWETCPYCGTHQRSGKKFGW